MTGRKKPAYNSKSTEFSKHHFEIYFLIHWHSFFSYLEAVKGGGPWWGLAGVSQQAPKQFEKLFGNDPRIVYEVFQEVPANGAPLWRAHSSTPELKQQPLCVDICTVKKKMIAKRARFCARVKSGINGTLSSLFKILGGNAICCSAVLLRFVWKWVAAMNSTSRAQPTPNFLSGNDNRLTSSVNRGCAEKKKKKKKITSTKRLKILPAWVFTKYYHAPLLSPPLYILSLYLGDLRTQSRPVIPTLLP